MSRLQTLLVSVLVAVVLVNYGAMAYFRDVLSMRDYSSIPNPQDRVGYCMMSTTTLADTYLLAETTAYAPSFEIYKTVVSLSLEGKGRLDVQTAMKAVKAREQLRERAHALSVLAASRCGFWKIKWPQGVTPLDVNLKWHRFDSSFWYFLSRLRAEPDAAELLYKAMRKKPVIVAMD